MRRLRGGGGDGVDMRLGLSSGITSAPGPIRLSSIGKKKSPFIAPIKSTESKSQRKWRTINSNGDVDSMSTANTDVKTPWMTGARACSSASLTRLSRDPIDVIKPWKKI